MDAGSRQVAVNGLPPASESHFGVAGLLAAAG
jgi:hypothetical protein